MCVVVIMIFYFIDKLSDNERQKQKSCTIISLNLLLFWFALSHTAQSVCNAAISNAHKIFHQPSPALLVCAIYFRRHCTFNLSKSVKTRENFILKLTTLTYGARYQGLVKGGRWTLKKMLHALAHTCGKQTVNSFFCVRRIKSSARTYFVHRHLMILKKLIIRKSLVALNIFCSVNIFDDMPL